MGATPHRWAQAASERRRSGLSPAATSRVAGGGGVEAGPEELEHARSGGRHELIEEFVDTGRLFFQGEHAASETGEGHLGGMNDRVASGSRPHGGRLGRALLDRKTLQAASELIRGGVAQLAHLVDGSPTA